MTLRLGRKILFVLKRQSSSIFLSVYNLEPVYCFEVLYASLFPPVLSGALVVWLVHDEILLCILVCWYLRTFGPFESIVLAVVGRRSLFKRNSGDTIPFTKLRINPLLSEWIGDIPRYSSIVAHIFQLL